MIVRPTPEQRAEMAAYIDATQPGLLHDLGIPRDAPADTPSAVDHVHVQSVIAEVLREHQLGWDQGQGFHCVSISCDWWGHDLDFPEHVAERVDTAMLMCG